MQTVFAILTGFLFACGIYCILRRSIVRLAIGIILMSQAANLLFFNAAGLVAEHPPLIPAGEKVLTAPYADPLPQALVLTAIVIGFGFAAFMLALLHRAYRELGSDDTNAFRKTDEA